MPAPYEKHHAQLKAILLAWGMPEDNAEATADILGWLLKGAVISEALSRTIAAIYSVVEATLRNGGGELALVAAQDELVSPSRPVSVQQLSI